MNRHSSAECAEDEVCFPLDVDECRRRKVAESEVEAGLLSAFKTCIMDDRCLIEAATGLKRRNADLVERIRVSRDTHIQLEAVVMETALPRTRSGKSSGGYTQLLVDTLATLYDHV